MTPRKYTYHVVFLFCCLYTSMVLKGQGTCSSGALAPVFSQTFGQGGSSSSKSSVPSGFITNYSFQSSGALNDGSYIVTPRVQNSGRGDWAQGNDHTGNSNGNMFLVNAGTGGSLFFSQQVDNLCPGSTYNFSAWLANVNTTSNTLPICGSDYVYPNVTFNIKNTSGTILATYNTGNLPLTTNRSVAPNWLQYGFSFALPSGTTSLVLEMVDTYGGQPQCGNDLAIDDILFTACTPTATASFSTSTTICSGTNTTINASIINSPFTSPAYQWQKSTNGGSTWSNIGTPGSSANSFNLNSVSSTDQASYRVLVGPDVASLSSNTCITASPSISLTVIPSPTASVSSNSPVCSGNNVTLSSTVSGGTTPYTYSWTGPNGFISSSANPTISNSTSLNSGTYNLLVTGNNNCTVTASTSVIVNTSPTVAAITGGDGGCIGSAITLNNTTPGGTWSSANPSVASVDNNGQVILLSSGSTMINYSVTQNGCTVVVSKQVTVASVNIGADLIECNNGVRSYSNSSSNPYYVAYSNTNAGNNYLWTITNTGTGQVQTTVYKGGTDENSTYPSIQLPNGNIYQIQVQYTTNGITCTAQHTVYKQILMTAQIITAQDTTVCYSATNIPLHGATSAVATSRNWRTLNGSGSFSSTNTLNTTYTPSIADKTAGTVFIVFEASTSLNMNGNCGSANASDTMALRILPDNIGTNASSNMCSGNLFQHTANAAIPGSTFTWTSSVLSGTGSGNAANGSGNISNTLTNLSATTDFVVQYTVTASYNGCTGTPYTVTVTVKPLPSLTITNNNTTICTGGITNIITSSTLSNTQYTWTSTVLSGLVTGASNNSTASATNTITDVLTNSGTGNAIVRYNITGISADGCPGTSYTDVTVNPAPSVANAGTDQSLCNATTANLNATAPVVGTGTWSFVSGPNTPSFSNLNNPTATVTGLITGSYIFRWTINNGVCTNTEDFVTIIVSAPTIAGTLSTDATVCATGNSGALTLTGFTGNVINWELSINNGGSWSASNITSTTYNFSNLTNTTLFRANVRNGNCVVETSNAVTITVLQSPTTSLAGNDQTLNDVTAAVLAANNPVYGTGVWSQISGPNVAIFANLNAHNSSISGLTVGTYVFRWTITNGSCGTSFDEMTLIVEPATVPGTLTANATVCATGGNGATLQLNGYTGSILQWELSVNNGVNWAAFSNTTNQFTYSNLTNTTLYRALVRSGIGVAAYSTIATITVAQPVTVANAGNDQMLCNLSAAILQGNAAIVGSGMWSFVSGPSSVNFADASQYNTTVSGLTVGTYTLRWTIANGVCPSTNDLVQIIVVAPTVAGTLSADATVCATGNSGTLTLTGLTGNVINWELSINNGGTWSASNITSTTYNFSNLTNTTLFRTNVQNGNCVVETSNAVTITVLQSPTTSLAGNDQTLNDVTAAVLAANNPIHGTGVWSQISGPNTAIFANLNTYNSGVSGLTVGTYVFRWTITNGSCGASFDEMTLIVEPATVPGTLTADATVCATGGNGATLQLNGYTGSILQWELSVNNGANWTAFSNTTNQFTYSNLTNTTLYRVLVRSGIGVSAYSTIATITVAQPVTVANAGNDQILCNLSVATLQGNAAIVGSGTWSFVSGPSAVSFADASQYNTTVSGLVVGTYTLRWTIANGICPSTNDLVQITVVAPTVAGTLSADAAVCATGNSGTLTLTGLTGNIINWELSINNGGTWSASNITSTTYNFSNLTNTTLFRTNVQNGNCVVETSNAVTITVLQAVTTSNAGPDQTACAANSVSLAANQPASGSGTWTQISGPNNVSFTNAGLHNSSATGLIPGIYHFRWTISNGICASSADDVMIQVDPATVAGTVSGNTAICANNNSGTITLTGNTGSILNWLSSVDNGNSWINIANTTNTLNYTNLNSTTLYKATVQSGVCNAVETNTVTIHVDLVTNPGTLNGTATICTGTNTGLISLTGNNGSILHWEYSTDGGANWTIINHTANTYTFNNLTTNTLYRVLVQNGVCANAYSNSVSITLDQLTNPGTLNGNTTVCYGSNNGTVQLTGNNGTVQFWQYSTDGGNTWNNIAQTGTSLVYFNLTQTTAFRAQVRNGVCNTAFSNMATITVTPLSIGGTITGTTTVCKGNNNGTLTLSGYTGSVVEWQSSTDGGNNWVTIINNSNVYNYANINTHMQFRVVVQNGICSPIYSNTVSINVDDITIPGTISGGGNYCSGDNNGLIQLTGNNGSVIRWEVSTDNGNNWSNIANTSNSYNYNNLIATSQFRALVQNGVCGAVYTNTVTINITDVVTNTITATTYTICEGQSVSILASASSGGTGTYQYQWQQSTDGANWTDIPGANGVQYNFIPATSTLLLRRVAYSLPCSKISNVVTVNMQASIANNVLPATLAICNDSTAYIQGSVPTGGDGIYTYTWQESTDGGANWSTISGATQKDYTTAALNSNVVYRRIVRTTLCTGAQENISNITVITIKHKPTAIFTALPDTGCSPVIISFQNLSTGNNAIYHFSFGDGKDSTVNTLSAIAHTYRTNTLVSLSTRLLAGNECGVDTAFKIVTIKPDFIQPNLILSDSSLCGPGSISFTNNTTGALKYTWDFGDGSPVLQQTSNSVITHQYTQPGTYQFTLMADNECSINIIHRTIRIHPSPVAAFTVNQPDYCVGDSIRINNQSNYSNQYRWTFSNNDSSSVLNPVLAYKNAGMFQATLIAGTVYTPDNKACFDTTALNINIVGTRKGTMQINSLTGNCLPHTVNTISMNTPASSVVWTWGDGISNTGDSASHKYFKNGQYLVTMVATSTGGCRYIDSSQVTVNSPTGSVSFSANTICLGQNIVFRANISDSQASQSDSIRWYFGDGIIKTTPLGNFSYQYTEAGIYHPQAWLVKASGCLVALTVTDSIRVDEMISKFGLSGVFECGNTTYRFADSSQSFFGIRSWKWIMNGRESSTGQNWVSKFSQKSSNIIALVVEGNSGCTATSQASFDVQVYQFPIANISAMAEACKTDLIELKSNVNSQDSVALRLWTLGNGINAMDSIVKATFITEGNYNIKLTVATVNNCYDSVYKQVTVHPLPKVSIQQQNTVCRGDSITLRANGASKYIWKDQNNNILCTDCAEIKIKPNSSMGYNVIGYNQFGCSEIGSTNVRVVNPLKMIASPVDTLCAGESTNLFAAGAASYQWLPNNGLNTATGSNATVRPSETTTYKVIGKDAFNCFTDTANIKVVVGRPTPITLGKDTTLVSGGTYQLSLQSATNDIVKWRWGGAPGISCATCPTPVVKLSNDACISCTAINQYGCVSTDTICIKTFCPTTEVFVPNAFTPDGDGINDKLVIQGKGIKMVKSFRIFNRWGEVVFEKVNFNPGDPAYGWDGKIRGKDASPDVYVYVCEVICEKGLPSIFKGNTAILK